VNEWITALYEKKIASRKPADRVPSPPAMQNPVVEFGDPEYPWPDRPVIPDLIVRIPVYSTVDEDVVLPSWSDCQNRFAHPSEEDIDEENTLMLRRQCLFRWAAQFVAIRTRKDSEDFF
jgi:hypothetical protein